MRNRQFLPRKQNGFDKFASVFGCSFFKKTFEEELLKRTLKNGVTAKTDGRLFFFSQADSEIRFNIPF